MKLIIAVLFLTAAGTLACTKGGKLDGISGNRYAVASLASARQLVPAIDTTSTGTCTGSYDEQANILTCTIAWSDLWRDTKKDTITAIAVYGPATATTNGVLVRSLPLVNPNKAGSMNLGLSGGTGFSSGEMKDFLAGSYYFTINTKRYPAGIVRGQLGVTRINP